MYVAQVVETGLGDSGREIRVKSTLIPAMQSLVEPAYSGGLKLPAPALDELVLVFSLDDTNTRRLYLPVRTAFSNITDDPDWAQIEAAAGVELEGDVIKLGVDAVEPAVLGDTLVTKLTDILNTLQVEQHMTACGLSAVPVQAATYASIAALISEILSGKVLVE